MPRIKGSPTKCVKTSNCHPSANTWVFLMKDERKTYKEGDGPDRADEGQPDIVKLRHPASNKPAIFVFSPGNHTVQEVLIFDENKRSWFIDDNVKSDGKLYLSTPIDPIFLVLPYLRKSQLAQPLEQCLWDEDFPETLRLAHCKDLKLSLIADSKGDETLQAFKFNEEKSLKWLQRKVERVADLLKQKGIHVSQGAVSATYIKSTKHETGTEAEYLKYAHGIVSEYLAEDLSKMLAQHLNIPDEVNKKRKLDSSPKEDNNEKKIKSDTPEESRIPMSKLQNSNKPAKVQKSAVPGKKELAKQRAAAGSKSITSFFKKN